MPNLLFMKILFTFSVKAFLFPTLQTWISIHETFVQVLDSSRFHPNYRIVWKNIGFQLRTHFYLLSAIVFSTLLLDLLTRTITAIMTAIAAIVDANYNSYSKPNVGIIDQFCGWLCWPFKCEYDQLTENQLTENQLIENQLTENQLTEINWPKINWPKAN